MEHAARSLPVAVVLTVGHGSNRPMGSGLGGPLPRLWRVEELSEEELDALVEEATIDAYGDNEQLGGFAVMIEDNLEMPFETTVLRVPVSSKASPRRHPASWPTACATATTRRSMSLTCRCPSRRRRAPSGSPPTGTGRGSRE